MKFWVSQDHKGVKRLEVVNDIFFNLIFHYARCNTPKHVTRLLANLRVIAPWQHSSFRRNIAAVASRWQHVSNLTGQRFKSHTSRSRDERVTARSASIEFTQ